MTNNNSNDKDDGCGSDIIAMVMMTIKIMMIIRISKL